MEDTDLKNSIKESVQEHLPHLTDDVNENLADFLLSIGTTDITHLRHVKEEDLVPGLTCMEARTLLEAWKAKYGKTSKTKPILL